MKGKPKLHIFYEHQLNTYLPVDNVPKSIIFGAYAQIWAYSILLIT